jgi:orotate phosphoribosyltransferase
MQDYQQQFIEFILHKNILRFGEFTLKSGRISPYFFNAGDFKTGEDLCILSRFYADAIHASKIEYDVLFGPAYKGIPLVCASSMSLFQQHQQNIPFAFNRKEAKNHGEGGMIVGSEVKGKRILLIDDVISAGTAIAESMKLLSSHQARLSGVVISFNRQERGLESPYSAIQEVEQKYQIPVISIITLQHLLEYLSADSKYEVWIDKIRAYQKDYGALIH